jgi:hypothetical protein
LHRAVFCTSTDRYVGCSDIFKRGMAKLMTFAHVRLMPEKPFQVVDKCKLGR